MKIGIDIDDVLVDTVSPLVEFHNLKDGTNHSIGDSEKFGLHTLFKCSEEEGINKVYEFFDSDIFKNLTPFKEAVNVVNLLNESNDLFAITARDGTVKEHTLNWFDEFFKDKFKGIFFTNQFSGNGEIKTKLEFCNELGVSILIEDRRKYALECAQAGIKVFLMDKPWNQNCEHANIIRVKNWGEIMEKLNGN